MPANPTPGAQRAAEVRKVGPSDVIVKCANGWTWKFKIATDVNYPELLFKRLVTDDPDAVPTSVESFPLWAYRDPKLPVDNFLRGLGCPSKARKAALKLLAACQP